MLRRKGCGAETILGALIEENRVKCKPPLLVDEVEKIAKSIVKYASGAAPKTPPLIPEDAFIGLPGEIVAMIDPHTEASRIAILGQLLLVFGNVIGRKVFY